MAGCSLVEPCDGWPLRSFELDSTVVARIEAEDAAKLAALITLDATAKFTVGKKRDQRLKDGEI